MIVSVSNGAKSPRERHMKILGSFEQDFSADAFISENLCYFFSNFFPVAKGSSRNGNNSHVALTPLVYKWDSLHDSRVVKKNASTLIFI